LKTLQKQKEGISERWNWRTWK